jgi:small subunit ribosomal protein S8
VTAVATAARGRTPGAPTRRIGVVSDPIADMLTRIRNASNARHADVRVPASRLKAEIAQVLKDEGYIQSFEVEPAAGGTGEVLRIIFKSRPQGAGARQQRVISGMKRISRPGLRVYARKTEIPRVLGGLGLVILSTSQGVMSGRRALKEGLGGEVLCYVW